MRDSHIFAIEEYIVLIGLHTPDNIHIFKILHYRRAHYSGTLTTRAESAAMQIRRMLRFSAIIAQLIADF